MLNPPFCMLRCHVQILIPIVIVFHRLCCTCHSRDHQCGGWSNAPQSQPWLLWPKTTPTCSASGATASAERRYCKMLRFLVSFSFFSFTGAGISSDAFTSVSHFIFITWTFFKIRDTDLRGGGSTELPPSKNAERS